MERYEKTNKRHFYIAIFLRFMAAHISLAQLLSLG